MKKPINMVIEAMTRAGSGKVEKLQTLLATRELDAMEGERETAIASPPVVAVKNQTKPTKLNA